MRAEDVGVRDVAAKHVLHCHVVGGPPRPRYSLLWRASGKPLPAVGSTLWLQGVQLMVDRIEPPGSLEIPEHETTLVVLR